MPNRYHFIFLCIIVVIIFLIIYFLFIKNSINIDNFTSETGAANTETCAINCEALQNLASLYSNSNMTVSNINITGNASITGTTTLNNTSASNINVTGNTAVGGTTTLTGALYANGATTGPDVPIAWYAIGNNSTNTGYGTGSTPISIIAQGRIRAGEFNAISSKNKKEILASGDTIQEEATELFKKMKFSKYKYKDYIQQGNAPRYGIIAEDLHKVAEQFVNMKDKEYIPNIYQQPNKIQIENDYWRITFKKSLDLKLIEENKYDFSRVKLILPNKEIEAIIIDFDDISILINCSNNDANADIKNLMVVYGTYEKCPSVDKLGVLEIAMVALQGQIKKIDNLQEQILLQNKKIVNLQEQILLRHE